MNIFSYNLVDSLNYKIEKKAVPGLIQHIRNCDLNYEYPRAYNDKGFVIQIPSYLKRRYYTFGKGDFWINFYDTTSEDQETIRSVNVCYDFDASYKTFVFKEIAAGKRKEVFDSSSRKKIYPFKSDDDTYAANIFMENNIVVFYYTKQKRSEEELRKSILSFRLKER